MKRPRKKPSTSQSTPTPEIVPEPQHPRWPEYLKFAGIREEHLRLCKGPCYVCNVNRRYFWHWLETMESNEREEIARAARSNS